jgi:hypothetical protein
MVSCVPATDKTAVLLSSQHHDDTWMGEQEITNLKSSSTIMPLKLELTF